MLAQVPRPHQYLRDLEAPVHAEPGEDIPVPGSSPKVEAASQCRPAPGCGAALQSALLGWDPRLQQRSPSSVSQVKSKVGVGEIHQVAAPETATALLVL